MRFKSFRGFPLGKPKDKARDEPVTKRVVLIEEQNDRARGLDELAKKIDELDGHQNAEEGRRPHGPIGELTIETDESGRDELTNVIPEAETESAEPVKLVEVNLVKPGEVKPAPAVVPAAAAPVPAASTAPATAPAPTTPQAPAAAPSVEGLNNLFRDEEEEENPLENLIKKMPEYTTHEIIEDLNEIKRIMKEWHRG